MIHHSVHATLGGFKSSNFNSALPFSLALIAAIGIAPASWGEGLNADAAVPVFKQYCFDCHSDKKSKGDINFEALIRDMTFAEDFKTWELAAEMLEFSEMPPEDEDQPSEVQRHQLVSFIRNEVERSIQEGSGDPGQVVLRRLTSAEYAYTIQDLTGLDLGLKKTLLGDAVGGEGFSNVGEVQFIQDSLIEQYLKAAKLVASHAIVGAGPLQFYTDPGMTGQELSAIHRIQAIYKKHGFSTGAGEGAEAFGLERYPKAFFASWRYRHRVPLGLPDLTLESLAETEGIEIRFLEHIWTVLNDDSLIFPSTEIVDRWRDLPAPGTGDEASDESLRSACSNLYDLLQGWQKALAANSIDDEEAPALTEDNFRPSLEYSFQVPVKRPPGANIATVEISVVNASGNDASPTVLWKNPRIRYKASGDAEPVVKPLFEVITNENLATLNFGYGFAGASIEPGDFITQGSRVMKVQFEAPQEAGGTTLLVDVELDIKQGDDCMVRCVISDGRVEGEEVSSTGAASALLANPNGPATEARKVGVAEFARKLPQVSHLKPAPSDRDPIPAPFDNTYNKPERNAFHYIIKYHRDDRFLTESILDDPTRKALDQAWTDLLSSFDYHDTFLRFITKKFGLELGDRTMAKLEQEWIDNQPLEARGYIQDLYERYNASTEKLKAAEVGHLEDAIGFAESAWRRPLRPEEEDRLRSFYSRIRNESELVHAEAIHALLARILTAPAFLYRIESPTAGDGIVPLSNFELASRLSYFLWSSQPDEALLKAAAYGELSDPKRLAEQAKRMLRDPNARRLSAEFFGQWFGFYRFDQYTGVDTEKFSEFTDELRAAMYDEAVSFFEHMIREDRSTQDILFADHTFLNGLLAEHYGIDAPSAPTDRLAKISSVNESHRGGLLQLGAVLTVTSAPLRTSAVKRGDWILRRLIGTPVPTPPVDVGSIPADEVLPDGLTIRQRLEAHRSDVSCMNCHSRMDPLGFALENFDSIGRWRDTYSDGQAIETTGILNNGTEISELDGLLDYLKKNEALINRNMSAKLLGYALGRAELVTDRPLLEQMTASASSEHHFSNLVVQIVTSPQFRDQRGRNTDADMTLNETSAKPSKG